ncbi:MAG: ABC transporter ATP-binding protein [Thermomicrobiales bacterium]|nr:ABC transporter ATP-binding protein [Thermomicrobiales bacterium]
MASRDTPSSSPTSAPPRSSAVLTEPRSRGAGATARDELLTVRNLTVEYLTSRGPVVAVDNVSFEIRPGEVFGLAGESGSGKSTVAHALLRVLNPPAVISGGKVRFRGRDVFEMNDEELEQFRWRDVSMVFQSAMNALNPVMSIGDQICDTIHAHEQVSRREATERAAELLTIVGIDPDRLRAFPHELSGGMRQRAVIATALALNPPLMIMDEPTTALDVVVQQEIMSQIVELKDRLGFSILFITHDLSLMVEFSTRIAIMYAGEIVELAGSRDLFEDPLHPYTQGLMASFPSLAGERRPLTGIPGSPPDMLRPPSGCRFHPRCAHVRAENTRIVPRLREVKPGHYVACHLYDPAVDGSRLNGRGDIRA